MKPSEILGDPIWYRALPLSERAQALRSAGEAAVAFDQATATRRVERWRARRPLSDDGYFAQRLATVDLTEALFHQLLGEPPQATAARLAAPPAWLERFAQAWTTPEEATDSGLPLADLPEILHAIAPLIRDGCRRLAQGLQQVLTDHPGSPLDRDEALRLCVANLAPRLNSLLTRVIALELNVARLQGLLKGETPEERFTYFVGGLRDRERALAFLREYPVIARQAVLIIDRWVAINLETLGRLCQDWSLLRERFSPQADPGRLTRLQDGLGDRHRGGRSVTQIGFESGLRLIYKPKPMAVENHFHELLTWIEARGFDQFRLMGVLDRGTYGWCEFIPQLPCHSEAEVHRFYRRQGAYLALLHLLQATDFHFENLIAHGDQPVLIDLETLFHPEFLNLDPQKASEIAGNLVDESVLRTGLLPRRSWANDESAGLDASGLGWTEGQLSPRPAEIVEATGTDEMRVERRRLVITGGQNRPTLNGDPIDVINYVDDVVEGFAAMYRFLLEHRGPLTAPDGPLARFADDEVRVVLRPTMLYSLLLREGNHPDLVRDALDRDRFFDRLWVHVDRVPYWLRAIGAEHADLWQNDIPVFTTITTARDLWTSQAERLPDFFNLSGMEQVLRRASLLSEADLTRQIWVIRASFATLSIGRDDARMPRFALAEPQEPATPDSFLRAARQVGDRLEQLALRGQDDLSWTGIRAVREHFWAMEPLGLDLYSGLPGVALFFAALGRVTGEERYTELARGALRSIRSILAKPEAGLEWAGAFCGWGGLLYAYLHLSDLLQEPALLDEAEQLLDRLPTLIEEDRQIDLLTGVAGLLLTLLRLHRVRASDRTLALAVRCGERLLTTAQPLEAGVGWVTPLSNKPLAGLSHGAAGMAWALLELAAVTGDERFRQTALRAISYEQSLFVPGPKNWLDLRAEAEAHPFMTAWCHGAPGVGMARLAVLPYLDSAATRREIWDSIEATRQSGFGQNHSLCHGDLGNLDLLLQAGLLLDESGLVAEGRRIGGAVLESIRRDGWLCGVPLGVETPGLMNGLAGIGYGLLRLAAPEALPSILMLELPHGLRTERLRARTETPATGG